MGQAIGKRSVPGVGTCGTPRCKKPKAPDRLLCEEHSANMDRIRQELIEDPRKLYNQRSDNPNRVWNGDKKKKPKGGKRTPTCCVVGCFNERVPPAPYCYDHEGEDYE